MEIEAKYRVAERRVFDDLLRAATIGQFALQPAAAPERQINTYLDTPDRRLDLARLSLRIREAGGRRLITVKQSQPPVDGVYVRQEWEIDAAGTRPADWPAHPLRDRVLEALDGEEPVPQFRIYTRRHTIAALVHRPVAEICLDEGYVSADGRVVGFRELEVELKSHDAQQEFATLLALLRQRYALVPESRSKRARGIWLLQRASGSNETPLLARAVVR